MHSLDMNTVKTVSMCEFIFHYCSMIMVFDIWLCPRVAPNLLAKSTEWRVDTISHKDLILHSWLSFLTEII